MAIGNFFIEICIRCQEFLFLQVPGTELGLINIITQMNLLRADPQVSGFI